MKISLVVSTRDNLKYLKWSYDSIRKNQGNHEVHICYGIDHCTDGTQDWIAEIMKVDPHVKSVENTTGKRLGHTIMYDRVVNEIVDTDIAMIFHSDMYLLPEALDCIEDLMYKHPIPNFSLSYANLQKYGYGPTHAYIDQPSSVESYFVSEIDELRKKGHYCQGASGSGMRVNPKTEKEEYTGIFYVSKEPIWNRNRVVSLTRIEPPLHPAGSEKIVKDFGTEPETFDEEGLLKFQRIIKPDINHTTDGVFAPWAFWVEEFKAIGGHDPLYAPQSKEDSDIFNRFKLNGCEFFQTWKGLVYHLTCRGSRFNPNLTAVGTNSPEWEDQNLRSTRNFIRKWGAMVRHTELLHPLVPHKYNIGFVVKNCHPNLLAALEIWCDKIVTDLPYEIVSEYISEEQPNTLYPLNKRVVKEFEIGKVPDVVVEIDGSTFRQDDFNAICYLSDILTDSGEEGVMELGNLRLTIGILKHYEHSLIKNGIY